MYICMYIYIYMYSNLPETCTANSYSSRRFFRACQAGPMRQSEINGLLRAFKGASVKMPMPQLEMLHPPQPLLRWNKGWSAKNGRMNMNVWKKGFKRLSSWGTNIKNSREGSKCICLRITGRKVRRRPANHREKMREVLDIFTMVYFPWPSIHPIHLCLCGLLSHPSSHWPLELPNTSHVQLRSVGCWWCPGCATLRVRHPPGLAPGVKHGGYQLSREGTWVPQGGEKTEECQTSFKDRNNWLFMTFLSLWGCRYHSIPPISALQTRINQMQVIKKNVGWRVLKFDTPK